MMNLSIPEAASSLCVSETRLRKTLAEGNYPALQQRRPTKTGLRQTTLLPPETIALLRTHFQALPPPPVAVQTCEGVEATLSEALLASGNSTEAAEAAPPRSVPEGQSVPLGQFHALLFQHNVLREEIARVTHYLDDCDHLLGEMVKTIASLEERTRQLEQVRSGSGGRGNALSGALHSVSSGLQNALLSRAASQPALAPAEVYYANVLTGCQAGGR